MRFIRNVLTIGLLAAVVSCGSNPPAGKPASSQGSVTPPAQTSGRPAASNSSSAVPASADIPKDAHWTIFCATITTPDHVRQAKALRDRLIQTSKLRDWYIVQAEKHTTLYYGFYREIDERTDKSEATRAHSDCRTVANLTDPINHDRMFPSAVLVPVDAADPAAPPEWNLLNAGKKGAYYTLQVGIYKDSPERKEAAVAAVREARAQGIEAYYYHGPTGSAVCIGAWPKSAVRDMTEAKARDPNDVVMVVPGALPMPQQGMTTPDGHPIEVVQPKMEILDPTLLETIKKYPNHAVNGIYRRKVKNTRTGEIREDPSPSLLVKVPQEDEAERLMMPSRNSPALPDLVQPPDPNANPGAANSTAPPADPWRTNKRVPASKGGKLKSIED